LRIVSLTKIIYLVLRYQITNVIVSSGGLGFQNVFGIMPLSSFHIVHSLITAGTHPRTNWILRCFSSRARFVSVSNYALINIRQHIGRIPSLVIYNGVHEVAASTEKRENLVLAIGHLVPYRRPEKFIEIAKALSRLEIKFLWIGTGELLEQCRNLASDLENVEFLGANIDVRSYLPKAKVLLHTSRLETFGLVLAEAMSCGTPCVVSPHCSLPEIIENGKQGFVIASDQTEDYVEKIQLLLDDPLFWKKMSSNGKQHWKNNYSMTTFKNNWITLINDGR